MAEILARQRRQWDSHGYCFWWWRERHSGELVGMAGLNGAEVGGTPAIEVGWSISPGRWGEGLAPEAGLASLAWAFEVAGLDEVVSFTLIENRASRRVMEKLGMDYEGEFDRKGFPHLLYRLRADRWRGEGRTTGT